jgi:hypothetical protein
MVAFRRGRGRTCRLQCVIVVVGSPAARPEGDSFAAAGLAATIARASAASGARTQLVGRVGEDPIGEAVLLDLALHDVGHATIVRDPSRATAQLQTTLDDAFDQEIATDRDASPAHASTFDAADLKLAFDYLPEYAVIVIAERLGDAAIRVAIDAAAWSGSALIVAAPQDELAGFPDDATVFAPPEEGDADGSFAAMVGTYAAGLDRGEDPRAAFAAAAAAVGSTPAD